MRKFKMALMKLPTIRAPPPGSCTAMAARALVVSGDDAQDGVEDIVDQGGGDVAEGAADDDAHGQVHHIAPGDKGLELLDEGSHKQKASFLFLEALR